ncbi:hypothetical protein MFIFM68171_09213 [Madurella fahalii]|uniref:Uncharacterized protein n=1 Tax=Madurella fahalii TaxID=1157608 RepID=A0ABQ0GML4_9PEZI
MPPINHAAIASVGIIAASVAVAAAIAIYESPEVRRMAEDLRRRIAIALHSLGDNVDPNRREPRFNRPEDAEGFYQSQEVDADDETRRRQREELIYWNALREQQKQREHQETQQQGSPHRGSSFDDFLKPDGAGEHGTFVYNTGASTWNPDSTNVLRRRGNLEGVRGLDASVIANPFSDEHGIELDERPRFVEELQANLQPRGRDEIMSDIYNATPRMHSPELARSHATLSPQSKPVVPEVLFDFDSHSQSSVHSEYATAADEEQHRQGGVMTPRSRSTTLERDLAEDEYMTAGQDDRADAYASIQAWAQGSNPGFYSPLPVSPPAPLSEPEMISEGQLTPTDSVSVVDVVNDTVSSRGDEYDVMSETDDGIPTPNSWSEVGSVISESESAVHA